MVSHGSDELNTSSASTVNCRLSTVDYSLILTNALFRGRRVDVAIDGTRIAAVEPAGTLANLPAAEQRDCTGFLLRPPFYNGHTHHAMTLLRGIDDDRALMPWLEECIWPRERELTPERVYHGTRLAIAESLLSGCVAFNDMYFHQPAILQAARDMGVRARVGIVWQDQNGEHFQNAELRALAPSLPPTLGLTLAPHALYTTTEADLCAVAAEADATGLPIHIHAAESPLEHTIARERFGAESPIAYLDRCRILRPGTLIAHACHLSDRDRDCLAQRGCTLVTCPNSNAKLASGAFHWAKARAAGIPVIVGTDGAASNNALSMIAETKAAALTAKATAGDPAALPFAELDRAVTETAAAALGFPNAGRIAPGADADLLLIRLDHPVFAAGGNPDANFIYAGDSALVDSVYCAGRCLVRNGRLLV